MMPKERQTSGDGVGVETGTWGSAGGFLLPLVKVSAILGDVCVPGCKLCSGFVPRLSHTG